MAMIVWYLQSVRDELVEKEERDTTGLETGEQDSYFLSPRGTKAAGKRNTYCEGVLTLNGGVPRKIEKFGCFCETVFVFGVLQDCREGVMSLSEETCMWWFRCVKCATQNPLPQLPAHFALHQTSTLPNYNLCNSLA